MADSSLYIVYFHTFPSKPCPHIMGLPYRQMSVLVCQSDFNWLYPLGSPEEKEESMSQILTVPSSLPSSNSKLAVTHAPCFSCRAYAGALWVVSSTIFFGHHFSILTFLTFWRPGGSAMQGWVLGTITSVCI